jgi:hypothetical protein
VEGHADSIAEVAGQFCWLGAAIRTTEGSSNRVCTSSPILNLTSGSDINSTSVSGVITFAMEHPNPKANAQDGQCWHALFRNPVVVRGYPIARRARYNTGLEIPLGMLSALTQSPRINEFLGGYYLKGYSTAVVPTETLDDAVLWHLYCTDDGTRLPYPDLEPANFVTFDLKDLAKRRHILGWCTEARLYAGE